jgi:hypothetical protein
MMDLVMRPEISTPCIVSPKKMEALARNLTSLLKGDADLLFYFILTAPVSSVVLADGTAGHF